MRAARWLAMALSVALISSCGDGDPAGMLSESTAMSELASSASTEDPDKVESEPWGAQAIAWWDAMGEAAQEGAEHMVSFFASDLLWEDRVFDQVTYTDTEWVDLQLAAHDGSFPWIDAVMLVSADEVLGSFMVPVRNGELLDGLDRMVIGADGVSHWIPGLGPLEACRAYTPWMCEFDTDAW